MMCDTKIRRFDKRGATVVICIFMKEARTQSGRVKLVLVLKLLISRSSYEKKKNRWEHSSSFLWLHVH